MTSKAGVFAFAVVIQIVLDYIIIPGFEILVAFFKSSEENHIRMKTHICSRICPVELV